MSPRLAIVLVLMSFLSACSIGSFYHDNFMSGQVVQVEDSQAVVCIGNAGGAEPGMVFEVFEVIYEGTITEGTDNYRREKVGVVEIQTLVDQHFARARVVEGKVERNNVIELHE